MPDQWDNLRAMVEGPEGALGQVVMARLADLTVKLRRPLSAEMTTHGWTEEARQSMLGILESWQQDVRTAGQP
jgi:hypothetical protein